MIVLSAALANKRYEAVVINNGDMMKKQCLRILIALIGVAGFLRLDEKE
jgi:hypothetical protein